MQCVAKAAVYNIARGDISEEEFLSVVRSSEECGMLFITHNAIVELFGYYIRS
jgi:hypothetical protein